MPIAWRRIRGLTITTFIVFCLLIALGVWQLHRLKWKEGILAQIHAAEVNPPIPLPAAPTPFQKVSITGHWIADKAALYGDEVHDTGAGPIEGGELIMPFRQNSGQIVLVDLGWLETRSAAPLPEPAGETEIVGYVHGPQAPGWFAGTDNPGQGLYYTLDPARIAAGLGLGSVAPFTLIAMGPLPPFGSHMPQPAQTLPRPPNNHYQYALTWFGFAFILLVEYALLARKRLRRA